MLAKTWIALKRAWQGLTKIKDTPHAIALGAGIGLAWNFIPSLGIGPIASLLSAKAFRGSGIASVTVNLATGFFIPLLYSLNLFVGRLLTGQWSKNSGVGKQLQDSMQQSLDSIELVAEEPARFFALSRITGAGLDFILGAIFNAVFAVIFLYTLILAVIYAKSKLTRSE